MSKRSRLFVGGFVGVASIAVAVALIGATFELRQTYDEALEAESDVRQAVQAARSFDFETATQSLSQAKGHITTAHESFSSPFVEALQVSPIAGPNLRPVRDGLASARALATSGENAVLATREADRLLSDTGIAIAEVEHLTSAVELVLQDAQSLRGTLDQDRGPWVVAPLDTRLRDAANQTTSIDELAELSLSAAAQRILGDDEPRTYLVLLGNSAEARELGGFAGGTALLTVEDGAVTLTRADRPSVLNDRPASAGVFTVPPPQRFLEHRPWLFSQNYTAMIDFPTLAGTLSELYPNMGGEPIDGVAYIDPQAMAAVIGLVGEVHLPNADMTVNADNAAHLINVEQYALFEEEADRELFLAELVASTFTQVLGSGSELDVEKLPTLIEAIRQDRLLFAPNDPEEYRLVEAVGLVGSLPERAGQDYLAVSHLNGGPNKLDAYLHRTVDYQAKVDPQTGELGATVTITLTNEAPPGLSNYAAGNQQDYPHGTNRAFVVVHSPHDAVEWRGGDEPELTRSWREFGLQRHEQVVIVPRGQSRTVSLQLRGSVNPGDYHLDIGHQPLVNNDTMTVAIEPTTGSFSGSTSPASVDGELHANFTLDRDTDLSATWEPASAQPLARSLGGE